MLTVLSQGGYKCWGSLESAALSVFHCEPIDVGFKVWLN
jgi:hypothetical protein